MTFDLTTSQATLLACTLQADVAPDHIDWSAVAVVAAREGMVLRLESWFAARGHTPPAACLEAIARARTRQREATAVLAKLCAYCELHDVPYVLLKLAQSAPDIGRDLDVLFAGRRPPALPLDATPIPLDIQCGRLGRCGEHEQYARRVLARRESQPWSHGIRSLPCLEDRILLLALSRMYGRPRIRLSDVCATIQALRSDALDPERLVAFAAESGLLPGLACYLEYVDQVVRQLFGEPLLGVAWRTKLPAGPWGRVAFREGAFRGPAHRVAPYLYARFLATRVLAGDFRGAGRTALLPLAVATTRATRGRVGPGAGGPRA